MPIAAAMIFFYLPFDINQDLEVNGLNITQAAGPPTSRPADSESTRPSSASHSREAFTWWD